MDNQSNSSYRHRNTIIIASLILIIAFMILPQFISNYLATVMIFLFTYIILAESYDIFSGYSGYYNLGHGSFFGLGAYAFAVFSGGLRGGYTPVIEPGFPIYISIPLAILISVLFAIGLSVPFFRLRGAYFSVATFGLILLLFYLANNLRPISGGPEGLHLLKSGDFVFDAYYLLFPVAVLSVILNYWVSKSKLGLALISIREDEDVAIECGINSYRAKTKALVLSAALASYAGCGFAYGFHIINPTGIFGLEMAFAPVVMTIFGGAGSFIGALLGVSILTLIQESLWTQFAYFHLFTYGILLLLVGLFAPGGIVRLRWIRKLFKPPE